VDGILIDGSTNLKIRTFRDGYIPSDVVDYTYTFKLPNVVFNPVGGSFLDTTGPITLTSSPGAQIHYTSNGGTISAITSSSTVRAKAFRDSWTASDTSQATYNISEPAPNPQFLPSSGHQFVDDGTITITCPSPGTNLRWTDNGIAPTRTSGNTNNSIYITSDKTIQAVCYSSVNSLSEVITASYDVVYPPGPVTVSGGGTTCNATRTLTASGGSGGLIYFQNMNSNGTSTVNQTTSTNVSSSGTYYFRAYNSSTGLWGTQGSASVTFNTHSTAPTSITGTNTICSGESTQLTASGGTLGTGASYQWRAGSCTSGTILGTSSSLTVSPTSATTYYARISGTCNTTSCASRTVTISSPPTVNVTGDSRCGAGTVNLSATTTSGTIAWYTSSTGGSPIATGNNYSPSISSTTTYYVGVSGGTCSTTTRTPVTGTVNPLPGAVTVSLQSSGIGYATIAASGGSGGTRYFQGTTSNGTSTSLGGTPQTVTNSATYYFRARSTAGCWGPQGSLAVNVPAGLSNLVLSNSPSGFNFSPTTYNYNSIRYLISTTDSIRVTPTGSGTITVNGTIVSSGTQSSPISISDGNEKTITIVVTQGSNNAIYTLRVRKIVTSANGIFRRNFWWICIPSI